MSKKLSLDDVRKKVEKVGYELLSDYYEGKEKIITVKHLKCGNISSVRVDAFNQKKGCVFCSGKNKKTIDDIFEISDKKGCILISDSYKNAWTPLKFKHKDCGKYFDMIWHSFYTLGQNCPHCFKIKTITLDEVISIAEKKDCFVLSKKYVSLDSKMDFKHNVCGNIFSTTFATLKRSSGCPKCSRKETRKKIKIEKLKKYSLASKNPTISDEWSSKNEDFPENHLPTERLCVWWICKKGHPDYLSSIASRNSGTGCPKCNQSKGEKEISKVLSFFGVDFVSEKKFQDCSDKGLLKFDFYIEKLRVCIEFDGIQHYEPVTFSGSSKEIADKNFKEIKKRDKIKDKYCKIKRIKMIRISYKNFDNIEKILVKKLNLKNS